MRRRTWGTVLLALAIVAVLATAPYLALGASTAGAPYLGSYAGTAGGRASEGAASRAVTVSVMSDGDRLKVSFKVPGYPAIDAVAVPARTATGYRAPFKIQDLLVSGSGTLFFEKEGGAWTLVGNGKGSAFGFDGRGEIGADKLGGPDAEIDIGEQVAAMGAALAGATEGSGTVAPVADGPASVTDPVEPTGPVGLTDSAVAYVESVLIMLIHLLGG